MALLASLVAVASAYSWPARNFVLAHPTNTQRDLCLSLVFNSIGDCRAFLPKVKYDTSPTSSCYLDDGCSKEALTICLKAASDTCNVATPSGFNAGASPVRVSLYDYYLPQPIGSSDSEINFGLLNRVQYTLTAGYGVTGIGCNKDFAAMSATCKTKAICATSNVLAWDVPQQRSGYPSQCSVFNVTNWDSLVLSF